MEQGKSVKESMGELVVAVALFDYFVEEAKRAHGHVLVRSTDTRSIVIKQPGWACRCLPSLEFPALTDGAQIGARACCRLFGHQQTAGKNASLRDRDDGMHAR